MPIACAGSRRATRARAQDVSKQRVGFGPGQTRYVLRVWYAATPLHTFRDDRVDAFAAEIRAHSGRLQTNVRRARSSTLTALPERRSSPRVDLVSREQPRRAVHGDHV